jgi:deoxycytidylate deaminase
MLDCIEPSHFIEGRLEPMNQQNRETFLALIAPIGIDINQVVSVLSEQARQISYVPNVIKLTDFFKTFGLVPEKFKNEVDRYAAYIKAGDKLCADSKRGDVLALLGISAILRGGEEARIKNVDARRINIIRQIKRLDEYHTLERVYGRNIIFVGCYASPKDRANYLVDRMRVSDRSSNDSKLLSQAYQIMSIDEDESDDDFGQKVIDCYPKSDFIIDCTSLKTLENSCERLIKIFFGNPFISPTKDEYSSYIANAASYRSLDLSRQVGAAIFGNDGEIISMGCNEVPAPGGGTYWCDHDSDGRDYVLGYDSNQRVKEDMARDAIAKLKESNWLKEDKEKSDLNDLTTELFAKSSGDKKEGPWRRSMLSDIIEYGRMVHAEMNAITDAARFRRSTQGSTLYCTTMPCHMCTKLIISSGISRVVYLQPYVKSLTSELFKDSVVFEGREEERKVNFSSLKGVTPAGFERAFSKDTKRKNDDGTAKNWDKLNAQPTFLTTIPYYLEIELDAYKELMDIDMFKKILDKAKKEQSKEES